MVDILEINRREGDVRTNHFPTTDIHTERCLKPYRGRLMNFLDIRCFFLLAEGVLLSSANERRFHAIELGWHSFPFCVLHGVVYTSEREEKKWTMWQNYTYLIHKIYSRIKDYSLKYLLPYSTRFLGGVVDRPVQINETFSRISYKTSFISVIS